MLSQAWGERYFSPTRWAGAISQADEKIYDFFLYF